MEDDIKYLQDDVRDLEQQLGRALGLIDNLEDAVWRLEQRVTELENQDAD